MSRSVVLFLSANPLGSSQLALLEECKAAKHEVHTRGGRDDFEFQLRWAVTVPGMVGYLDTLEPTVIHFSGHGGSSEVQPPKASRLESPVYRDCDAGASSTIQLVDGHGRPVYMDSRGLTRMIGSAPSARLVVLNACFTDELAQQLCSVVDCVIGMRGPIGDAAACVFSVAFYGALGNGRSVGRAVEQAVATLSGLGYPDERCPVCCTRGGVDADRLFLPGPDGYAYRSSPRTPSTIVEIIARNTAARQETAEGRDLQRSSDELRAMAQSGFSGGRDKVEDWRHEVNQSGWSEPAWFHLGVALERTHEAIEAHPSYQRAWTLLAEIYHLVGDMELGRECLERSRELATPGPYFPGRYYAHVKGNIDAGYPFNAEGGLTRQSPPPWFMERYRKYLTDGTTRRISENRASSMRDTSEYSSMIDFLILTAIEVERKAVCEAFGLSDKERVRKDTRVYWRGLLPVQGGGRYELVVAQALDMASVDMAVLTNDAIHHWKPASALLIGIAGSADKNVHLGDVVVASEVYYYERGKQVPGGRRPEPKILPPDATLWSNVNAMPDWDGRVPVPRPDDPGGLSKLHKGVIASGEKVIADEASRDEIAAQHRKIVAVEMEGYGFSRAVWQSFSQVRSLVVRGICDDGSPAKGDRWHIYAAAAAASFARRFLEDRPIAPRSSADLGGFQSNP